MTNNKIQFIGTPCGHHGNYTFYKAFKYLFNGKQKILSLGEFFFFKIWKEEDIISIGEVQLLWEEKTSGQVLVSLRLYFLPENTPEGRCEEHGEHEVVSLSEKVVMRAEDVINNMRAPSGVKWDTGLSGVYGACSTEQLNPYQETPLYESPLSQTLDIKEILREKNIIGDVIEPTTLHVIVLGYDKYCRIRALLKRVEGMEEEGMRSKIVKALGGFLVPSRKTRLLFCRDVFDYPELEGHELLCNHLAPKLQGRPRKKMPFRKGDSESESSETSEDQKPPTPRLIKPKPGLTTKSKSQISNLNPKAHSSQKASHHSLTNQIKNEFSTPALNRLIEVDFMSKLYKFMKDRNTAITRVPYLGYKQLNVFELFTRVQQLGGYDTVSANKLWSTLFEEFAGKQNPQSPQQGTNTTPPGPNVLKRHYERLLLPYENYLIQEQKKLLGYPKKYLNKMQSQHKHLKQSKMQHNQVPIKSQKQRLHSSSEQYNNKSSKSGQNQTVKTESGEPSVSILQPVNTCAPVGASYNVSDGGSTTITLLPVKEEADKHHSQSSNAIKSRGIGTTSSTTFDTTSPPTMSILGSGSFHGSSSGGSSNTSNNSRNSPFTNFPAVSPPFRSPSPPLSLAALPELMVPKVHKKDGAMASDLAKRPEITITPIPRSVATLGPPPFTPLQLADLMTLNANLNSHLALQDLAKIAERYGAEPHHSSKKLKTEDGSSSLRVNGASQRSGSDKTSRTPLQIPDSPSKSVLPVPELVSADFLRQMNAIENNSKLLLPAHQSTKTINAIAALLPQTSIYPAPAPAAHQQQSLRSTHKSPNEVSRPEPILQNQSVYSQSKSIYGKPTAGVAKDNKKRSSPEIEILDLRIVSDNRSMKSKNERSEIELLDLTTRKDITVSAVPRPGTSKLPNKLGHGHSNMKSESNKASTLSNFNSNPLSVFDPTKLGSSTSSANNQNALASPFAAQGIPPALAQLGINPSLLHYMMPSGMKPGPASTSPSSVPVFPYLDPSTLSPFYGLFSGSLPSNTSPNASSSPGTNDSAATAAAHQVATAAMARLAQLNSLGLSGLPTLPPEAIAANLGIYKNYLHQGNLPAPHFLSGLMSPGGTPTPPTSK